VKNSDLLVKHDRIKTLRYFAMVIDTAVNTMSSTAEELRGLGVDTNDLSSTLMHTTDLTVQLRNLIGELSGCRTRP
jgi:hypothetical protein